MDQRYDMIVVGSGPAGISAAINGTIRNKRVLVFGSTQFSEKVVKAPRIDNYLGFYGITGKQLLEAFEKHTKNMGIQITEEKVEAVYAMGDYFAISTRSNMYEAYSVVVASGVSIKRSILGEEKYLGKGVGYCATCDAPLYKNKTVVIVGYDAHAEEEANFMLDVAAQVFYLPMYSDLKRLREGVQILEGKPKEIAGDDMARKLILNQGEIIADGFFILKESVDLDQLVPGVEMEGSHFKVNRSMETNIPGLFAAGDCTGKPYQYMKAAGEGQVAGLNAVSYLDRKEG